MNMKKLSALILCFTMLLSMSFSAEVYAHEEDIMRTENYQKTKAFVDSGDIYDLGLYSMEDAVRIIGRQDPDFADLCGEPQTVASLAVLISQEDDEFLKNMTVYSRLDLYSDYLHKPLNIDVNWEVQVNMIINKWFSTTLTTNLMYDDDVKIVQKDGTKGARVQFKEILGVGVQFNF